MQTKKDLQKEFDELGVKLNEIVAKRNQIIGKFQLLEEQEEQEKEEKTPEK